MTHASATAQTTDAAATDPVVAQGLSMLDEPAQIGMVFARALGRIAQAAIDQAGGQTPELTPQLSEGALAFSRVSRAVCMAVGLKNKILRDRQVRPDRLAAERAEADAEAARLEEDRIRTANLRRAMTGFIVGTAIETEERDGEEGERLFEALKARIDGVPHFEEADVKETAYAIARDLGVDPGPEWWREAWDFDAPTGSATGTAGFQPATRPRSPGSRSDQPPDAGTSPPDPP